VSSLADSHGQFLIINASSGEPEEYTVEGTTFSPYGLVKSADGKEATAETQSEPLRRLAEISSICNDSKIVYNAVCILAILGRSL
jgi:Ca2+ transporting ATPase